MGMYLRSDEMPLLAGSAVEALKRSSSWRSSPSVREETVRGPSEVGMVCCLSIGCPPNFAMMKRPSACETNGPSGAGRELLSTINIKHLPGRVGEGFKVKLRNDEV